MAKSRKSSVSDRLILPIDGNETIQFFTQNNTLVAQGYTRVVIGQRGPYIEFQPNHIKSENLHIPENQIYRIKNKNCYYIELRTKDESFVKVYLQKRTVQYADYKIGLLYISLFDLTSDQFSTLIQS